MDENWNDKKFIGKSSENIIQHLIQTIPNWKCIEFGVEQHINDLREAVIKHINTITKKVKSMPDFVAFNTETGETHFIEVKFRSKNSTDFVNGKPEYHINFLEEYKKYWEGTKLIILQDFEPYIFVVNIDLIDNIMLRKEKGKGAFWNFEGIKEDIRKSFPELTEESINKAIKNIIKKEDE